MRPGPYSNQAISHRTTNLASLRTSERLYLYIVVYDVLVSAALFKENEHEQKKPIFFISKSLYEVETRYTRIEQAR